MVNLELLKLEKSSIIVVLGASGSGKTTFINAASGSSLQVGSALDPCTTIVQLSEPFDLNGQILRLVDTPGDEDADALKKIADFLASVYERQIKLLGLVYFQNISSPRVGGLSRRNMRIFRDICGEGTMKRVIIVTTGIDSESDTREMELQENPKFFRAVIQEGARLVRHDGTVESARGIVLQLVRAAGEDSTSLKIQEQLSNLGKGFSESVIGVQLDPELAKEIGDHEQAMKDLRSTMQGDSLAKPGLGAKVKELRALVALTEAERDELADEYHAYESTQGLSLLHALILGSMMLMALWVL
ncbi:hypothetical protein E1B28_008422 [Marasmius oreades]|uniref:G domain-containing protein n=1 Tax=Marasmius oreades TaxID=181124 RepID=A0A9P7UTA3_9AGAR|nr:uncharacterized protein E1B28_008422 [Marasmius oreades]KAG7092041.1 hypothetical protein E1B28_008422 [Marasmius oreades]